MEPIEVQGEFYNVGEKYTLYDTIAVVRNLSSLSKQPPGWYASFAAFSAATQHSFFNVRNEGNTDDAYCNLDTKDQTAFAFLVDSISVSFWGSGYAIQDEVYGEGDYNRMFLSNPVWQALIPFNASLTLRVQQDEKLKANALMLSPGHGPWGGGYGNNGGTSAATAVFANCAITTQTQGIPAPDALFRFPNPIKIPRRAALSAELSFTPWARAYLAAQVGPGWASYWDATYENELQANIMYGIQCALNGTRLVQQRGALHA